MERFEAVGTGMTVFEDDAVIEGPVRWLDSPQAVLDFVGGDAVQDTIVVARGGTTTFLTPALNAGVKGIVTLMGAPESHLGILSREYGIPCVMGVTFTDGVRSARGEVIPADGVRARLDVSSTAGRVLVEPGAPSEGPKELTPEEAAVAEQMAAMVPLLQNFQGAVPHGAAGDAQIREGLTTDVLELTDDSIDRDLTIAEINDLERYMAWNIWDFLALRATEGESGLIPRQEYECFGCVMQWQRLPAFYRLITETVGVDGVVELGRTARREPGSKANLLHVWCTGFTPAFGRAILGELGIEDPGARADDLQTVLQFMRRLYKGLWDEGPMFTSMRGYTAPILDPSWIERFAADVEPVEGERRVLFTKFNASTELLGFLLHFDNRSGLNDSGPYDLGDGRFMIVRDHFLHDPAYHWHDVAEGLPHCLTQAMVFQPDGPLETQLMDGGTLFTKPANYLKHLESVAVYARDTWDTPASEIRRVDEAEMTAILERCDDATTRLYKRIASMPKRDKIVAGAQVYYTEFVLPFARLAGVWDTMVDELDFHEIDPVASEAYYPLVRDGLGVQLVGKLFITGTGFPSLEDPKVAGAYERFLAVNTPFKALCRRWQDASEDERFVLIDELADQVARAEVALRRTVEALPDFEHYLPRLRAAFARAEAGEHDHVTDPRVDSLHNIWMEVHEAYLQTLGRSREQEGSF
ncbi:MAG TPA: PEP-utilizing enzyme [Baekduia sp.]|nr:PEP-utilizing enzyme [Baekduia sp.]